ncbi:MAG TPA: FixH family protein [Nitrospirota bacterium]|nr:FixH family protein [Nitrospirota bacterium]
MKKKLFVIVVCLVSVGMLFGCSKGYESQKTADDLKITLSVDRYPLIKGDNALSLKVADAAGKAVTDAAVNVRYFMPAMPGMAPMDFNTQAVLKGDRYAFSANVLMEGGWKAEVSVMRQGKPASTATFNLDAR